MNYVIHDCINSGFVFVPLPHAGIRIAHAATTWAETLKFARDPQFVQKLRDVVGLYLNPLKKALVFIGELRKARSRPRNRAQTRMALQRQTHDHKVSFRWRCATPYSPIRLCDRFFVDSSFLNC